MKPDITLYEYGPSRSKQARWALLECELEFKAVGGLNILHSEELKKVNPMGKVPAMLIDGKPLFEAAAICTYLADLVPEKGLIAPSGTMERALHMQWVSFALTEMEAYLWSNARNTFVLPKEQRDKALFGQNIEAFLHAAKVLDKVMADSDYLINNRFSVTDILVGFTIGWGNGAGLLEELPNLQNYLERLKERPHCTL
ncbi:MAG: glutathione S-transferase family protein [Xanthomonadales bacterium]|nr:glutathione S-transferase family protein [Xanthomonadales bacterium]